MKKRRNRFIITFLTLILLLLIVSINSFGPYMGAMMFGKPVYIVPPNPERYGRVALDFMETMGVYAGGESWPTARKEAEDAITMLDSIDDVNPILEQAIKVAGGKHSFMMTAEENEDVDEGLYASVPKIKRHADVLILKLPGFMGDEVEGQTYADALVKGIDANRDVKGVIVDLRDNTGGDMGPMIAGISPLIPDGEVMSFKSRQGNSPVSLEEGESQGGGMPLKVEPIQKLEVPTAILQNEKTASSAEATLLAFKGLDNCRFFGIPTAGYASANVIINLYGGHSMVLTYAKDLDRTGAEYAEEPIPPDVETDQALEAALDWILS